MLGNGFHLLDFVKFASRIVTCWLLKRKQFLKLSISKAVLPPILENGGIGISEPSYAAHQRARQTDGLFAFAIREVNNIDIPITLVIIMVQYFVHFMSIPDRSVAGSFSSVLCLFLRLQNWTQQSPSADEQMNFSGFPTFFSSESARVKSKIL
jgi:hypothetical protein